MTTLILSNSRTEEMVGELSALTEHDRYVGAQGAKRQLWFARDGDIVVLPRLPDRDFLEYVTAVTRTDPSSLAILAPPDGLLGPDLLTPDRLRDLSFRRQLRAVLDERPVSHVITCYTDWPVTDLIESMGIVHALPGHAFSVQGGNALVNSKAAFRAVAAGADVPVAPGVVTGDRRQAAAMIGRLLADGHHAIVKKDFSAGGFGNEILSRAEGVRPAGAKRVVVLPDQQAVERYVDERWSWLTGARDDRLVIERYFADSTTVYAEFVVSDRGCSLLGCGQILMEPISVGEIVPPPSLSGAARADVVEKARRLCESFAVMGYRGNIAADAFLTPAGDVFFSETNGRLTGSTHLHTVVGDRLIGETLRSERVCLERVGWQVGSFRAAVDALHESGLAFDPAARTGVVLTADYAALDGVVMYCIVARDLASAEETERRLRDLATDGSTRGTERGGSRVATAELRGSQPDV